VSVLGIDPGTRACGFGVVEASGRRLASPAYGVIRLGGELPVRLARLFEGLEEILSEHGPEVVAVEGVFTRRNPRSALVLGHARGVVLAAAGRAGLEVCEYAPATVKRTVAGSGRATKESVQTMVKRLVGISDQLAMDASDALAIAVCHLQHHGGALPARTRLAVHDFREKR